MSSKQVSKVQNNRSQRAATRSRNTKRTGGVPIARNSTKPRRNATRLRALQDANQVLVLQGTDTFQLHLEEQKGLQMVCNILANPLYWYGTRIAGIAKVYQKYRPRFLKFRYDPSCPATTSGSITIGVIEAGVTMTNETAVSTLLNSGGRNINIFESGFITYTPRNRDLCYIDGDITKPVVNPFCFFMYALNSDNAPPGLIHIDWEYEFYQGTGDQNMPIAVYTNTTPENILAMQSHSTFLASAQLTFGWGAVLGFLKVVGVPILRKIGVVVCKSVLALLDDNQKSNAIVEDRKLNIRDGTFLTIDPSDVYTSPANYTRVKDSNGSDYYLPDTARVAIYMSGDQVQVKKTEDKPFVRPKQMFKFEYPNMHISTISLFNRQNPAPEPFQAITDYWCEFTLVKDSNQYEWVKIQAYYTKDSIFIGYQVTDCAKDTGSDVGFNELLYNSMYGSYPPLTYFMHHRFTEDHSKYICWPTGYDLYTTQCKSFYDSCPAPAMWSDFKFLKPGDLGLEPEPSTA